MPKPPHPPLLEVNDLDSSAITLGRESLIVLLGCPIKNRDGRPNFYFEARVAAGALAYHALSERGTPRLLCTGLDEAGEVTAFRDGLIEAGVPGDEVELDGQAARTIDSIDFVADLIATRPTVPTLLFVSQRFHLPRVLFLARSRGLDAHGLIAEGRLSKRRARLRESAARARAVVDVRLLRRSGRRS